MEFLADRSHFQGVTDSVPLHLIMIDEIANNHPLHHETVFEFLKPLFERSHEHLQVSKLVTYLVS